MPEAELVERFPDGTRRNTVIQRDSEEWNRILELLCDTAQEVYDIVDDPSKLQNLIQQFTLSWYTTKSILIIERIQVQYCNLSKNLVKFGNFLDACALVRVSFKVRRQLFGKAFANRIMLNVKFLVQIVQESSVPPFVERNWTIGLHRRRIT